ncbi:hypothetical protein P3706_25305, partial [Vibrio parahaemolyticus]|nr:hypothetical protein [Vibrio parahaemolyticus]
RVTATSRKLSEKLALTYHLYVGQVTKIASSPSFEGLFIEYHRILIQAKAYLVLFHNTRRF